MKENIFLNEFPKIEFQFLEKGFHLIDEQTETNSGFYAYSDLENIELNKTWFPKLAKCLRVFTWIINGVPFFPDSDSYKKAQVVFHFKQSKLGFWLTNSYMVKKAKLLKKILDKQNEANC